MKNRDMFYQNIQQGYQNPGMFIPPNGYNMNTEYQAYGMPNKFNNMDNNYEDRISRLERQVKVLDNRLQKLEASYIYESNDNFYTI